MKIIAMILLCGIINVFADDAKGDLNSKAALLKVDLAFIDKGKAKFIITVTNVSSQTQTVLASTLLYEGSFISRDVRGNAIKLYATKYRDNCRTGIPIPRPNELKPKGILQWEVPIKSLVYFRMGGSGQESRLVTIDDLRGLTFVTHFERLGVMPKKLGVSYNGRNAAQKSKPITIQKK